MILPLIVKFASYAAYAIEINDIATINATPTNYFKCLLFFIIFLLIINKL